MTTGQCPPPLQQLEVQLKNILKDFPQISIAFLFGSLAVGSARSESDLDLAVAVQSPLASDEKVAMISRHLFPQVDFMPCRARVVAERREAWINKSFKNYNPGLAGSLELLFGKSPAKGGWLP